MKKTLLYRYKYLYIAFEVKRVEISTYLYHYILHIMTIYSSRFTLATILLFPANNSIESEFLESRVEAIVYWEHHRSYLLNSIIIRD